MKITRSWMLMFALLLGLGGCSMLTFGYNHGDWLLRYWIHDYTAFNKEQKKEIEREVDDYMRWHRQHALPEYIAFLQGLNKLVMRDRGVTADDVARERTEVWRLYRLTMAPMIPPAARILRTLDSAQIAKLANRLAEKNNEYREENLGDNEQEMLEKRAERYIDIAEDMVGRLDAEQQKQMRQMSMGVPPSTAYFDQRETKQAALVALLNAKGSEAEIAALFKLWTDTPEASRSAQHQLAIEAYDNAMNVMIARIHGMLKPHQKRHLSEKLNIYIDDFERLYADIEARMRVK